MFEVDFTLSSCCAPQSHGVFVVKRDIGRRVVKQGLIFVKNLFGCLINHSPREPECACRHDIAKIHVSPLIFY